MTGPPSFLGEGYLTQIMEAAKMSDGKSSVDRIYVMSYDYPGRSLQNNKEFMLH